MAATSTRVLGGRYVLGEVLGTGGMATVWWARDQVLGRDVAVKVLSPQYAAEPGFLARFEREARHAAGLVHRDIKPANIVLTPSGEVKVLDFGIAKADGLGGGTGTLAVLGTATYLSPEQASGHPAGPQSDLYSLGCVLFEMLTGTPPFSAESAVGVAYRHVHDDPGPPSARRPGLPERLDQITARLLAKNPAGRPGSAAAARAGLLAAINQDATAELTPQTFEPVTGTRGRSRLRRPRLTEAVLAVGLAASLAVMAVVLTAPGRPPAPAATHPAVPQKAHKPASASHKKHVSAKHVSALPPAAAAAGAFVGDLQAAVADGQVTQQAGQDLFNHLQQLLFGPPGQDAQHIQQQYQQLLHVYDQHQSQGDITGPAASRLRHALETLGTAVGAG